MSHLQAGQPCMHGSALRCCHKCHLLLLLLVEQLLDWRGVSAQLQRAVTAHMCGELFSELSSLSPVVQLLAVLLCWHQTVETALGELPL